MRMIWSEFERVSILVLLLIVGSASAVVVIFPGEDIKCVPAADWSTYFNGVLGGASLTLLLVMMAKTPESLRQFFKKKHAIE